MGEFRVHRATQAGITGTATTGAESVVVSGGYEDDEDYGDLIISTGHGGRDPKTGKQTADQSPEAPGNAALITRPPGPGGVAEPDDSGTPRDHSTGSDTAETLGGILRLPALKTGGRGGLDWSPVEAKLGAALPQDYKRFIDSYGAGLIDDHVTVCAPNEPRDWADLLQHNGYAHECVRLDFSADPTTTPEVGTWATRCSGNLGVRMSHPGSTLVTT